MEKRVFVTIIVAVATALLFGMGFTARGAATDETYAGKVEHVFTHELVYDGAKAYSADNTLRRGFDKDHITTREFNGLLKSVYDKGYVLVELSQAVNGTVKVPVGKKPLCLSFDDMTYDTTGRGCVDKLVYNGAICDYTKCENEKVTRERECVPVLEKFIEEHPDFSPYGARATLCVNGYNGIFGYRIAPVNGLDEQKRLEEVEECKAFCDTLKSLGYRFACHSFGHLRADVITVRQAKEDLELWKKYVSPIVGDTDVFCFPSGAHSAKSDVTKYYMSSGFNVFLCVGEQATAYENTLIGKSFVYRRPFDGVALRTNRKKYMHLVDTKEIYDESRYLPFNSKSGY